MSVRRSVRTKETAKTRAGRALGAASRSALAEEDALLWNLRRHGAPLSGRGRPGRMLPLEDTLARALALARWHPVVADVWPIVFARNSPGVDLGRLESLARRLGQRRVLGFFVSLLRTFMGGRSLGGLERRLRDGRARGMECFFLDPCGERYLELARLRTPDVAKGWGFWMITTVESFRDFFSKHMAVSDRPPLRNRRTHDPRQEERMAGKHLPKRLKWEPHDPSRLAELAGRLRPDLPWLPAALRRATRAARECASYSYFVDPTGVGQPGAEWQFETNVVLESPTEGEIVLDMLKDGRVGGVEFLARLCEDM